MVRSAVVLVSSFTSARRAVLSARSPSKSIPTVRQADAHIMYQVSRLQPAQARWRLGRQVFQGY